MARILLILLNLLVTARLSIERSVSSDLFYNAGVVEFRPSIKLSESARLRDNLEGYLEIIASDQAKSLDILVFPESTLNSNGEATFVPDPLKSQIPPCDSAPNDYHHLLRQLSCAARNSSIYVVINLTEKEWCSQQPLDKRACADTGLNLFNTNVVLDRAGVVVSRYRKVNLYGEDKNTTWIPEFGWFEADFGVRFGHFICFDILFYSPAQELVQKHGIKDFIFPTMWFSQLPFLTAVQFHQAWSYSNDVNFLAAGASNPAIGTTGSGIYNGRNGMLVATMQQHGMGERALYTAKVPKYSQQNSSVAKTDRKWSNATANNTTVEFLRLKTDYMQSYTSQLIDLSTPGNSLSQELCFPSTDFCCHFQLKWQQMSVKNHTKHYFYRLGVFDGQRYEPGLNSNQMKNCALFSCSSEDIRDCGTMLRNKETDVVFESIIINATFPTITKKYLLMPSSLTDDALMPIPVQNFNWTELPHHENKNSIEIRYSLNVATRNLMAFAIYANYFDSVVEEGPRSM